MTKKELKKRLFAYKSNKAKLESNKLKLEGLTYKITPSYSGMPTGSDINNKNENYIIKKEELEHNIKKIEFEIREVDIALNSLAAKDLEHITLRYLEDYKPAEVSNLMHISESSFWRDDNRILKSMIDIIKI